MRIRLVVPLFFVGFMSTAHAEASRLKQVWYPSPLRSLSPDQLAQSFLETHLKELGVPFTSLKLMRQQESLLAYHFVYQQYINSLPIQNATISISILKKDQAVYQYYSTVIPGAIAPTLQETITEEQAYDAAWAYIGVQGEIFQAPQAKLHYKKIGPALTLVYSVELSPLNP